MEVKKRNIEENSSENTWEKGKLSVGLNAQEHPKG